MKNKKMTTYLGELFQLIHQYEDLGVTNTTGKAILTPSEMHIVECIGYSDIRTSKEIGEILGITKGAVSQQLKKLLKDEVVEKRVNPEDKRESYLLLTTKGLACYKVHEKMQEDFSKSLSQKLTKTEREGFMKGLEELNNHLKQQINLVRENEK